MPILYIFGSVIIVSLISLVGISTFFISEKFVKKTLLYFVSFSVGALLGSVFIHMLPEVVEETHDMRSAFLIVLGSFIFFFVLEKVIHLRHCHDIDCDEKHKHPVGLLNLIGDAMHNFVDGMLIAGSFLVSIPLGVATSIAVALHEIPQELGDFAILIYSGYSRGRALFYNLLSALMALVGALLVITLSAQVTDIGMYLIPVTAGNFLYIAGADLIPELRRETKVKQAVLQFGCMLAGIVLMYVLA